MDETMNTLVEEEDGQMSLFENETAEEVDPLDEVRKVANEEFDKIRLQSMLLGSQVVCRVILGKIIETNSKPGKRSMADYRRLVKSIEEFCRTGISKKVNADGTVEETTQN